MSRFARRPSPAMVVAVVALSFALAGSAIAGTDAATRAVTKSKVKKIAKKQANKVLNQKAAGLSVANAQNAENAENAGDAENLGGFPAADYVRGHEIVTEESEFTSVDKDFSLQCPEGKQVIGGGARLSTQDDNIAIQSSNPSLNGLTWHVSAVEVNDTDVEWALAAYAICANV
jgi:hypothetical protein